MNYKKNKKINQLKMKLKLINKNRLIKNYFRKIKKQKTKNNI